MEKRKQKEIEFYDQRVGSEEGADFEGFRPLLLQSYQFWYALIAAHCKGKRVLDYGCGSGVHSFFPARQGADKVVGIDLSQPSLEIARERAKSEGVEHKVSFRAMDCEKLDFADNSFDVVIDGGTFSSLDLTKAFSEIARVLKPEGVLIGIETLGHNPLTNVKRKLNVKTGKRTEWAASHIFQMKDVELARKYFEEVKTRYFHLFSWIAFPFLGKPGGKLLLHLLQAFEGMSLHFPPVQPYGFKIVFVFRSPKKEPSS